jgi:hypothetical protein
MTPPDETTRTVRATLLRDPNVRDVELVGSRASGRPVPLSDWDFVLRTESSSRVAEALPVLVGDLDPLARQWDRLGPPAYSCYMLMLAGPRKIDLIVDVPHRPAGPWVAAPDTLGPIDAHLWDWTLWLAAKRQRGLDELVRSHLVQMHTHLLAPIGVARAPRSIEEAIIAYVTARDATAARLGIEVSTRLEREVRPAIARGAPS